ncbi:MAG: hypothetical protein JO362_20525 [Streptomycetaceae bacterium]|nr:hypothetical protein [Streptomycetaceae bacterium]
MSTSLSADWSKLGLDWDPVSGDLQILQRIVDDFRFLRDTAWLVSQGLDAFVASASSGGFEGAAADSLRGVISGRLKAFVDNITRAFSLAGEAVAEYRLALARAQQAVSGVAAQAAGMTARDPKLEGLKNQVSDQLAQVRDAEALMIRALEDASQMVSQPIKVPSLFERIWKGVEMALDITAMVLTLLSTVVDGPLGVIAAGIAGASLAMTVTDYAGGRTNVLGLVSGIVGLLLPTTKGIFTLEEAGRGLRTFTETLGQGGRKAVELLASPPTLAASLVQGGGRTWQAFSRVPGLLVDELRAVPRVVAGIPQALKGLGEVIGQDFAHVQKWYPDLTAMVSAHGAYVLVNAGRALGALFTPMTFEDIATLGFRGAWRVGWKRASWSGGGWAFRSGWKSYGSRSTLTLISEWQMLRSVHLIPPKAKGTLEAAPELVVPGRVKWADRGVEGFGEPLPAPVPIWTVREIGHETFTPSQSRLLMPTAEPIHDLDTSGAGAGAGASHVSLGDVPRPEPHTDAENLRAVGISPIHLDSHMQVMLHSVTDRHHHQRRGDKCDRRNRG